MRHLALRLSLAILIASGSSRADVSPAERAMARELFDQGRELMADKRYSEACSKLAESQRLDPAPGTLLNLAVCHQAEGKTASAWSEFHDALTLARRDGRNDRVELATKAIAELEPRLSRLRIDVPERSRLSGLAVKLDGSGVGRPVWGAAVPVDPGVHVIAATAPGRSEWRSKVSVADDGDLKKVTVPVLERLAARAARADHAGAREQPPESGSGQHAAGYVVGGLGLLTLGFGAYSGVRAFSRWDERNSHCDQDGCDRAGVEAGEDAERAAVIANIAVGIGVAGTAVGAYLVLSSGNGGGSTAVATPTRDGRGLVLSYDGRF